jgi:putative endonuclease
MPWTVYLARCRDGTLYAGVTTDPTRRLAQHNAGCGAAYTRSRGPVTFVYWEPASDRSAALRRERAIKQLTRAEKEALICDSYRKPARRSMPT